MQNDTATLERLAAARQHHSPTIIAQHLGVSERQIRRWEAKESSPPQYVGMALQRLLPLQGTTHPDTEFKFIDLFAGIGGIRIAFDAIGGECVFTSEWDSYARRTYMANFGGQHPINGDITLISAEDIPDFGGLKRQPSGILGLWSTADALEPQTRICRLRQVYTAKSTCTAWQ